MIYSAGNSKCKFNVSCLILAVLTRAEIDFKSNLTFLSPTSHHVMACLIDLHYTVAVTCSRWRM